MSLAIASVLVKDAQEMEGRLGGAPVLSRTFVSDLTSQCCAIGYLLRAAYIRGLIREPNCDTSGAISQLAPYFEGIDLDAIVSENDSRGTRKALEELSWRIPQG